MPRKVHVSEHTLINSQNSPCSHIQKEKPNMAGAPEARPGTRPVSFPESNHNAEPNLRVRSACSFCKWDFAVYPFLPNSISGGSSCGFGWWEVLILVPADLYSPVSLLLSVSSSGCLHRACVGWAASNSPCSSGEHTHAFLLGICPVVESPGD